ncbi:4-alpha-glucanotransferase [Sphingomonas hengshuiensis]|uniref:4-alpha-glucanotransferase n=1 Tax=Sphingomonas hengshuiensis TaxID=1609977 RepID=A0A7U4J6J1_9SPHN|nr:4-alpha-glucanotransferase [Sphingomonas hengshuiensis]AJP71168.1 4-alpha-glucanotransferase [Sphingomonas hengshuiensis]
MSALHDLAAAVGLPRDWEDAAGTAQQVSDAVLATVLARLDFPAASSAEIAESRDRLAQESDGALVTADVGRPIRLPDSIAAAARGELLLEDGTRRTVSITSSLAGPMLAPIDQPGYHRLDLGARVIELAVAPARCFGIADAVGPRRIWGPAVQIPGLRDDRGTAFGDFGTLADSARAFAAGGADAVAISPVHALFPADPGRFSPYAPSSREFLNVLLGDPALAGVAAGAEASPDLIDWEHAIPQRIQLLRRAYAMRSDSVREQVAAYRAVAGDALERHARFDALHAHFRAETGAHGWQGWPTAYQNPDSAEVARFAGEQADEVDFHVFLQWLARHSLEAAQRSAVDAGMGIGLIADLAVGMDAGGSHGWSRRDELLAGLSIGAPPDLLGPSGQNWGITGFSPHALRRTGFAPFIATLRAALESAGGIRIDHALGLRRLWVVPEGATSAEGAYLTMPMQDLFRLLALESHRARAVVIGEDLGTVPEGFRPAMDARGILGMRVLWFERDAAGSFLPARDWSADAVAMTGTHDLSTIAGWWTERDIDWNWQIERAAPTADEADDRAHRTEERAALWRACTAAGTAEGSPPAIDNPAPAVDAAVAFVGATPCTLALVPMEDIVGLVEQPNLPGTVDEHPNWRRRMPDTTEALLARTPVARRIERLNTERSQ